MTHYRYVSVMENACDTHPDMARGDRFVLLGKKPKSYTQTLLRDRGIIGVYSERMLLFELPERMDKETIMTALRDEEDARLDPVLDTLTEGVD